MNYESLITSLLNEGRSIDDIAGEFTQALNEAKKRDEERKAAEVQKEKERVEKEKQEWLYNILRYICDYITKFYPELADVVNELDEQTLTNSSKELAEMIETYVINPFRSFVKKEEKTPSTDTKKTIKIGPARVMSADETNKFITDFLKVNNIF